MIFNSVTPFKLQIYSFFLKYKYWRQEITEIALLSRANIYSKDLANSEEMFIFARFMPFTNKNPWAMLFMTHE